jgi:CheY-like chemotaxis protein
MAFKRALVVDDSRSARISLKRLLEDQGLEVHLADCGEAAIDLLHGQHVDVIFMDHTMPGMDGLEAVTAIKANPSTATIPIMMYTTKEGEVYVSQARALGAIGVLPKKFQPHVLFDMLLELGLVNDRRGSPEEERPEPPIDVVVDEVDRDYEQQALGMSVQTLVKRILEDQHLALRADILQSHKDFAKQVAAEIIEQQRSEHTIATDELIDGKPASISSNPQRASRTGSSLLAIIATAVIIILGSLYWQTNRDLNLTRESVIARDAKLVVLEETVRKLIEADEEPEANEPPTEMLNALGWAVNRSPEVAFDQPAFDDARARQMADLLEQLAIAGFQGKVQLESHLGEFCLTSNDAGDYELAADQTSLLGCNLVGHPLDASRFPEDRQTDAFSEFLATTELSGPPGIDVEVIAHDRLTSVAVVDYPTTADSAGAWNEAASRNHRVEISLLADNPRR